MTTVAQTVHATTIVVVGRESVGKSQLITSLTGQSAGAANFRGSTVDVELYSNGPLVFADTPGLHRRSDADTTRRALAALEAADRVLLVVQATQFDSDLHELLPLVQGRAGAVVATFWDKVQPGKAAQEALQRLSRETGVAFVAVDARKLTTDDRARIDDALAAGRTFAVPRLTARAGWRIEPRPGWLEHRLFGPVAAACLLLLPALAAIFGANRLAAVLHPLVEGGLAPLVGLVRESWPEWAQAMLVAERSGFGYGLLNMLPFLLVWALPTVLLFAVLLGAYKASGLVDRINVALHPYVRPLGLSGRDLVRVAMGFGCNVPAVISTRACSGCSRGTAISAIAFGAACSYQLPATLAVLNAQAASSGRSGTGLAMVFLVYLLATTAIYLRLTAPAATRSASNELLAPRRPFMQWPSFPVLLREATLAVRQFFRQAIPVFVGLCLAASLLAACGVLDAVAAAVSPAMAAFGLPGEAALPVVFASVRKDGLFLLASPDAALGSLTATQALTAVYLSGVLLPCLVTALAIARETSWGQAGRLLARQAAFACLFSLTLAWAGPWILE